jgi:hypothetical protein
MKSKKYNISGVVYWKTDDGRFHRDKGPAVKVDGNIYYFKYGLLHREDGPAVILHNDEKYYLDGIEYEKRIFYKELVKRNIITVKEAFVDLL